METRGAILAALFLSCTILPLLVSPNPDFPGNDAAKTPLDADGDIARMVRGFNGAQPVPGFGFLHPMLQAAGWGDNVEVNTVQEEPQPTQRAQEPQPTQGAQEPLPMQGAQVPQPMQGAQEPQPTQGAQEPQPTQGAQEPQPTQPAQEPQPTQGAQEPQPMQGAQEPQPTQGAQEPQPTQGAQEPQPTQPAQEPQPMQGAQEPQPTQGAQEPQPMQEAQEPQPMQGAQEPQPTQGAQEPQPTQGAQEPQLIVPAALVEGFYQQSCPQVEKVVYDVINDIFRKDQTLAASLIRLFLHDCFVTGCDASILLDQTPTGELVEKNAPQNGIFVRGFEVIDEIKARLEAECPGIVSCADVLAFANRESLVFTGVRAYPVAAGRRDSLVSLAGNVQANLPFPDNTAQEIIDLFQRKGFSVEEMVVLTGAHSVGSAHCTVVSKRFRDPKKTADMDPGYVMKMQVMTACLNETQDLAIDPYSQQKMDSRFYKQLLKKRALLESDQNLAKDPQASMFMRKYVGDQVGWLGQFTAAITKLGGVEVLTGNQGEVRKQCSAVN